MLRASKEQIVLILKVSFILTAMDTPSRSSLGQDLPHLESFNLQLNTPLLSFQHDGFYNMEARYCANQQTLQQSTSTTPPISELTTLSLKTPPCPLCKGQKYGFTAYFHNPNIFPEPPHDLLPFVEKSYILKNRLKSLLVTYIMRELELDGLHEAEKEVLLWRQLVEGLLSDVASSATGFELSLRPMEEVRKWTEEMTRQIRESIERGQKLEIRKGTLITLLLEFRKLWEGVWKGYLLDRMRNSASQYSTEADI